MVAQSEEELPSLLDKLAAGNGATGGEALAPFADARLIETLRAFIHQKSS